MMNANSSAQHFIIQVIYVLDKKIKIKVHGIEEKTLTSFSIRRQYNFIKAEGHIVSTGVLCRKCFILTQHIFEFYQHQCLSQCLLLLNIYENCPMTCLASVGLFCLNNLSSRKQSENSFPLQQQQSIQQSPKNVCPEQRFLSAKWEDTARKPS